MPRYRRHYRDGQTVFLTIVTRDRRPWMNSSVACQEIITALRATRLLYPFSSHGYVLLHDHLHLLLSPHLDVGVPDVVGCFKRATQAGLRRAGITSTQLWQKRYYDHIVRDEADFARHLDYLHFNPVKHGLCTNARTWAWSSLGTWMAHGVYPPTWGVTPPDHIRGIDEA